jgi:hypothetical protein
MDDTHDHLNKNYENVLIINNQEYKLEKIWRNNKNDLTIDSKGELFPYPKAQKNLWANQPEFLERLDTLNKYLDFKKKYTLYETPKDCLICGQKNVTTRRYKFKNIMWEDGLTHYIDYHNIEPTLQFKQFIFTKRIFRQIEKMDRSKTKNNKSNINNNQKIKIIMTRVKKQDMDYVMIERNQMLILDALMIHGGYVKRYIDLKEQFSRYSEHAGLLEFEGEALSKIVVSGKTTRVDEGDEEIFLPMGMDDMFDYEYIFHTHPPTPKPGGRAVDGILYEFPSIGDIYHFIDHHNDGNVIGSLVITAEGLYNIRKNKPSYQNINVDDDELYKKYQKIFNKIQKDAIEQYGTNFSLSKFYAEIAQDTQYIDRMNETLNEFDINIDFYPRIKDHTNNWVIDTVFLVFRDNKKR